MYGKLFGTWRLGSHYRETKGCMGSFLNRKDVINSFKTFRFVFTQLAMALVTYTPERSHYLILCFFSKLKHAFQNCEWWNWKHLSLLPVQVTSSKLLERARTLLFHDNIFLTFFFFFKMSDMATCLVLRVIQTFLLPLAEYIFN